MRGCLFTLVIGAVAIALLVVVGLPQVYAGILTGALTAAGLQADDTTVTVSSDPPTDLLGLHADTVTVTATDARFRGMRIGALDLRLGGVAVLDRTAETVDGTLRNVTLTDVGGEAVVLDEIGVGGDSSGLTATTTIAGAEAERLIAKAIEERAGVAPDSVSLLAPDTLRVALGVTVEGTLAVNDAGDLVVRLKDDPVGIGELTLLRGGSDLPIRLTGVRVTKGGDLRLEGDLAIGILG